MIAKLAEKFGNNLVYGSLVILQCLFWGVGNPIVKIGLRTVPPFYCTALRFTLAFVLFMLFFGKSIVRDFKREYLRDCLIIGLFTGASFIFSTLSLLYTSATISGFLLSLSVVFTPILSIFILRNKIGRKMLLVIILVVLGMYFLCGNSGKFSFGLGEIYALLSALSGAAMLTYSSKHISSIGPITLSTAQSGVAAVLSFVFAFIFEDFHVLADASVTGWLCIVYLAVACTCIAYLLQNLALKHVSATFVSLAFCSEPIFTAIAAFLMLGEMLSLGGVIGAVLIIIGICIASMLPSSETARTDEPETKLH